jgi:hypothetical protein
MAVVQLLKGVKITLHSKTSRSVLEPIYPPVEWALGTISLGLRRPGREVNHSPPCSTEVKKIWIYISTPPYVFMTWCLISYAQRQLYVVVSKYATRQFFILSVSHS